MNFPQLGSFLMEIEASSVDEMQTFLKQLSGDPKVEVAYPDNLVPQSQAITAEIAQYTVANAAYESVHLIEAWEIINGLPKSTLSHVNVSVIDDGMYGADCLDEDVDPDDANKTAIKEALESEFPNDDSNPVLVHEEDCEQYFDDMEHGTAVVSILAAKNHAPGQTYPFSGILSSAINLDFNVLFFDVGSRQYEKTEARRRIRTVQCGGSANPVVPVVPIPDHAQQDRGRSPSALSISAMPASATMSAKTR